MVQGTDGILQNYFTLSFEQCFCLQCMVVLCLALMMRWYQLYVWSLHHFIFHFYKNSSWVNILDSTGFSLYAFEVFCISYVFKVSCICSHSNYGSNWFCTISIPGLLAWIKTLQVFKKKFKDQLIPETEDHTDWHTLRITKMTKKLNCSFLMTMHRFWAGLLPILCVETVNRSMALFDESLLSFSISFHIMHCMACSCQYIIL